MNRLIKRFRSWIKVIYCFCKSIRGSKAKILTAEETVEKILCGKSLIRFGDGEFGIYHGRGIAYQKCSDALIDEFQQIKKTYEYEKDNCPFIIAVPKAFFEVNGFKLAKKRSFIASWSESRADFIKSFNQNIVYGDAFLFKKSNKEIYSRIWKEGKRENIIFVHNNKKYADYFEHEFGKKVYFIKCPSNNSFECIQDILFEIKEIIRLEKLNSKNLEIVISSGPAGKVLVRRLSLEGFLCIDTGHCWDEPLIGME